MLFGIHGGVYSNWPLEPRVILLVVRLRSREPAGTSFATQGKPAVLSNRPCWVIRNGRKLLKTQDGWRF